MCSDCLDIPLVSTQRIRNMLRTLFLMLFGYRVLCVVTCPLSYYCRNDDVINIAATRNGVTLRLSSEHSVRSLSSNMSFWDASFTPVIPGTATPPSQMAEQNSQTLNDEVTEVFGQLERFWGGFRKQVSEPCSHLRISQSTTPTILCFAPASKGSECYSDSAQGLGRLCLASPERHQPATRDPLRFCPCSGYRRSRWAATPQFFHLVIDARSSRLYHDRRR
jgi:hypothetical protein